MLADEALAKQLMEEEEAAARPPVSAEERPVRPAEPRRALPQAMPVVSALPYPTGLTPSGQSLVSTLANPAGPIDAVSHAAVLVSSPTRLWDIRDAACQSLMAPSSTAVNVSESLGNSPCASANGVVLAVVACGAAPSRPLAHLVSETPFTCSPHPALTHARNTTTCPAVLRRDPSPTKDPRVKPHGGRATRASLEGSMTQQAPLPRRQVARGDSSSGG